MPTPPPDALTMPDKTVDFSVTMLDAILGRGWEHYVYPTADVAATSPGSALASMFMIMNTTMLTLAGIVFAYFLMIGVVGTAHEGTPLGKKLHSVWVPFRGVFGAGLLMPLPWTGGFSLFQAILLKFTHISIIIANMVMAGPLDYMGTHMGVMTAPVLQEDNRNLTANVLQTMVIRQTFAQHEGWEVPGWNRTWIPENEPPPIYTDASMSGFLGYLVDGAAAAGESLWESMSTNKKYTWATGYYEYTFPAPEKARLDITDLGVVRVPCVNYGEYSTMCVKRIQAIETYFLELNGLAATIVSNFVGGAETEINPGTAMQAERALSEAMYQSAMEVVQSEMPEARGRVQDFVTDVTARGWAMLGAYHWSMTGFQEKIRDAVQVGLGEENFGKANVDAVAAVVDRPGLLRANLHVAALLAIPASKAMDDGELERMKEFGRGPESEGLLDKSLLWMSGPFQSFANSASDALIEGGDPVGTLSSTASMITTAIFYGGTAYAGTAWLMGESPLGKLKDGLLGSKNKNEGETKEEKPKGPLGMAIFSIIVTVIFTIFVTAMVLGFYLPAVPFIIWTMGVIGWLLGTLLMLAAAPVWAFAHMLPEGEGFAGQRGASGYTLLFNVLLRPVLMVVGFFISVIVMIPVAMFIGAGMKLMWASTSGGFMFLLGFVAYLIILCVLVIGAAHKIYGIPVMFADKVISWLGGPGGDSMGEMNDLQTQKGSIYAGLMAMGNAPREAHTMLLRKPQGGGVVAAQAGHQRGQNALGANPEAHEEVEALNPSGGEDGNKKEPKEGTVVARPGSVSNAKPPGPPAENDTEPSGGGSGGGSSRTPPPRAGADGSSSSEPSEPAAKEGMGGNQNHDEKLKADPQGNRPAGNSKS